MKRLCKRGLSLTAAAFFAFSALFCRMHIQSSAAMYNIKEFVSTEEECFYVNAASSGLTVKRLYPSEKTVVMPVFKGVVSVQIVSDYIYVIYSRLDATTELVIDKYSFSGTKLDTLVVDCNSAYGEDTVCVSENDRVYMRNPENSKEILCFDFYGNVVERKNVSQKANYAFRNSDGRIVILAASKVFAFYPLGNISTYDVNASDPPVAYLGNSYYASNGGSIYRLTNVFEKTAQDLPDNFIAGGVSDNYICTNNGKSIYALPRASGEPMQLTFKCSVTDISACGDTIFVLTSDGSLHTVSESMLEPINEESEQESSGANEETDAASSGGVSETEYSAEYFIESDVYIIDTDNFRILRVAPDTNVTAFLKNINHNFESLTLTKSSGELYTSGRVRCGSTASFSSGNDTADFTVIVTGDLNSNGVSNTADAKLLMSYLLGESEPDAAAVLAADVNFDGEASLADLLFLYRSFS